MSVDRLEERQMSGGSASARSDRLAAARVGGGGGAGLGRVDGAPALLGRRAVLEEVEAAARARVDARLMADRSTGSAEFGQSLVEAASSVSQSTSQRAEGAQRASVSSGPAAVVTAPPPWCPR